MNASRIGMLRNVAILFGIWTGCGLVGGIAGYLTNFLPSYIASRARPGSLMFMFLRSSLTWALVAVPAGFLVVVLIQSSRTERWATALAALLSIQFLGSWSNGWHWVKEGWETIVGMLLSAVLISVACAAGYLVARKRVTSAGHVSSA